MVTLVVHVDHMTAYQVSGSLLSKVYSIGTTSVIRKHERFARVRPTTAVIYNSIGRLTLADHEELPGIFAGGRIQSESIHRQPM